MSGQAEGAGGCVDKRRGQAVVCGQADRRIGSKGYPDGSAAG
ncbi:hypothetical protein NSU01_30295 [Paenibacillus sp. FSL H8-0259]